MKEQRGMALRLFGLLNGPQTMGRGYFFWIGFLIIITVAYVAPTHLGIKPYKVNEFLVSGFLAASLSLLWGYCGILSLGQAAFFGIGGYTFGILGINMWDDNIVQRNMLIDLKYDDNGIYVDYITAAHSKCKRRLIVIK